MPDTPKARLLVVEDDPAILKGLCDVFLFNGYAVASADRGDDGLAAALAEPYDLVILDVMLPGLDGFGICRELRRQRPDQAIIMLTAKSDEDDILTGFHAGADDYVPKPFSIRELVVRVEAVLRRSGRLAPAAEVRFGPAVFDPATLVAARADGDGRTDEGPRVELTRREMDITAYLARHRDRIVSKKELLERVWHYPDGDIETRTVDIHILKLRKKAAEILGDAPFILTVRGEGYRLAPEPETAADAEAPDSGTPDAATPGGRPGEPHSDA